MLAEWIRFDNSGSVSAIAEEEWPGAIISLRSASSSVCRKKFSTAKYFLKMNPTHIFS